MTRIRNKYQYKTINGRKLRISRHIMEEKIGRALEVWEHVFHIDGDASNNDPENLIIIPKRNRKDA